MTPTRPLLANKFKLTIKASLRDCKIISLPTHVSTTKKNTGVEQGTWKNVLNSRERLQNLRRQVLRCHVTVMRRQGITLQTKRTNPKFALQIQLAIRIENSATGRFAKQPVPHFKTGKGPQQTDSEERSFKGCTSRKPGQLIYYRQLWWVGKHSN